MNWRPRGLFTHGREMKPLFDSLAQAHKTEFILNVWQNNIAKIFNERVLASRAGASNPAAIPAEIPAQQLAGTLMTLIVWWMDHHYPLDEEAMERQFHRLTAGLS